MFGGHSPTNTSSSMTSQQQPLQPPPPQKKNTRTGLCKICSKSLINTGIINCHSCDMTFHQSCTGVTEEFYQYFVVTEGCPWYCHFCEMKMIQNSNSIAANIEEAKTEIHKAVDQQFNTLSATIFTNKQEINHKMQKLEESFRKEIQSVKEMINTTSTDQATQSRINFLEAQLKRKNIIINGVPQSQNEDLYNIIKKIGQACNVTIEQSSIEEILRLKPRFKPNPTLTTPLIPEPAILVKFFMESTKTNFFNGYLDLIKHKQFLRCNSIGLTSTQRIYINHHLSPVLRKLYDKALHLKKAAVFQTVNSKSHAIGIKINDVWHDITTELQLDQLITKQPIITSSAST
jgi:hypothetical protein